MSEDKEPFEIHELLEIHKLLSEELRHMATTIWQFAIAIVTLQGGAVGLSAQKGFDTLFGNAILAVGFFLAFCFSIMLLRQALERRAFVGRIQAVEGKLRERLAYDESYSGFFKAVPTSRVDEFKSDVLARILVFESIFCLLLYLGHLGVFKFICPSTTQ